MLFNTTHGVNTGNDSTRIDVARLCRAKELLRGPDTLAQIARSLGMSPYELIRQFRAVFGQTPHVYRTRERLEQARQLLLIGNHSVTEVCFEVGFSSLGSFSTLFTRHVGMTPSAFRRTVRRRKEPHNCFALMYTPRNFQEASELSPR